MHTIRDYLTSSQDSDGAIYAPDMLAKMELDGCATWDMDCAEQAATLINAGWHIDNALWQAHLDAGELECHDTVTDDGEPDEQHALLTKWRAVLMVTCMTVGAALPFATGALIALMAG